MGRASKEAAERHHDEILDATAQMFFNRGISGVGIPEIMAEVGLTRGAFYRHFESKENLASLALERTFDLQVDQMKLLVQTAKSPNDAVVQFMTRYLSAEAHKSVGSPMARMCSDVAREPSASLVRTSFAQGVRRVSDFIAKLWSQTETPTQQSRDEVFVTLSTIVGATMLSRATAGDPISTEILAAVRKSVLEFVSSQPEHADGDARD